MEWTKFAVRFREVSGLESVRLERVDCTLTAISRLSADEWQKSLKQKLEPQINAKQSLPEEEVVQLGKKDPIAYPSQEIVVVS